jgi:general secretion pathway protein F
MATFSARIQTTQGFETVLITADNRNQAQFQAEKTGHVISLKRRLSLGSGNRLSRSDRAIFLQRVASMISSRMGAAESLKLISETFSGQIGDVAGQLEKKIRSGKTMVEAMEELGTAAFPEHTMAIIRTGSQGGDLGKALSEAVSFEQELASVKGDSAKGLWSAAIGFFAGILALLGTTLYIVPEMERSPMVQELGGGQLIWVTLTADIMTWIAIFVTILVVLYLLVTKLFRLFKPAEVDRLVVHIPYIRDVVLASRNHVAFYGLSVLLSAGLRVEEAIRIAHDGASRGQLKEDFQAALNAVRSGRPWPNVMQSLHPTDRAALATSQDKLQIAHSMKTIAEQYKNLYKVRVEQLVPACQMAAALFLTASGVVLFGAVILPMLEMTRVAMTAF